MPRSQNAFFFKLLPSKLNNFDMMKSLIVIIALLLTTEIFSQELTRKQAIQICKDQGYSIKKRSARLTQDISGNTIWKIDGKVLFRRRWYKGAFEINTKTGAVAKAFAVPWD